MKLLMGDSNFLYTACEFNKKPLDYEICKKTGLDVLKKLIFSIPFIQKKKLYKVLALANLAKGKGLDNKMYKNIIQIVINKEQIANNDEKEKYDNIKFLKFLEGSKHNI